MSNTVRNSIEKAVNASIGVYFQNNPTVEPVTILDGQAIDEKVIPCVVCLCDQINPVQDLGYNLGNFTCELTLAVLSNAYDTDITVHRNRSRHIVNAMEQIVDLKTQMTANGVHLYDIAFKGEREGREGDDILGNTITYELTVCSL